MSEHEELVRAAPPSTFTTTDQVGEPSLPSAGEVRHLIPHRAFSHSAHSLCCGLIPHTTLPVPSHTPHLVLQLHRDIVRHLKSCGVVHDHLDLHLEYSVRVCGGEGGREELRKGLLLG